jgi:hypothetical protein
MVYMDAYEYQMCLKAIRAIASGRKSFAQVFSGRYRKPDLEFALAQCLHRTKQTGKVFYWIKRYDSREGRFRGKYRWQYGFYRQPWTLAAYEFIYGTKLSTFNRDWMAGLLFGYKPAAIQKFLDKQKAGT